MITIPNRAIPLGAYIAPRVAPDLEARLLMGAAVKPINSGNSPLGRSRRKHQPRSPIDKAKAYEVVWNNVSGLFDAARLYEEPCFVYFIGEEHGPIKIGNSKDPIGRLRTMQTGNPRRLRIEHVLMGAMPLEKLLHELWEPYAIRSAAKAGKPNASPGTEWFTPEIRETLLPIIVDASGRQTEYLQKAEEANMDDLGRLVRDAHAESGFVAQGRDEVRLLGSMFGYSVNRPSRI
jgi:hypothetical protein